MRILITGAAGFVGRHLARALADEHDLRLADVAPPADEGDWCKLDITDPVAVHAAMQGIDAVVHLAVATGHEGDFESDAFNQTRFDVNVRGTWNVMNAAAQAGVRRVVHTSSIMVVMGYPPPEMIAGDAVPRPVGTYAVTKMLGEQVCEQMHRSTGLSIVCIRIAKPVDLDDAAAKAANIRPQWIAIPDLVRGYELALAAPDIGFEIVTLVGESSARRYDLSRMESVLGYRPQIRLEEMGYSLGAEDESFTPRWER